MDGVTTTLNAWALATSQTFRLSSDCGHGTRVLLRFPRAYAATCFQTCGQRRGLMTPLAQGYYSGALAAENQQPKSKAPKKIALPIASQHPGNSKGIYHLTVVFTLPEAPGQPPRPQHLRTTGPPPGSSSRPRRVASGSAPPDAHGSPSAASWRHGAQERRSHEVAGAHSVQLHMK